MKTLLLCWMMLLSVVSFAALPVYPGIGHNFELDSTQGKKEAFLDATGEVRMVSFGFTHCPDICPLMLQRYSRILNSFENKKKPLPIAYFISVDPKRDTIDRLKTHVKSFHPEIRGLRPTQEELTELKQKFAMAVESIPGSENIAHTDRLYLFDKKGQLRGLFSLSQELSEIQKAIEFLQ